MKKAIIIICLLALVGGGVGCSPNQRVVERLQKIEAMEPYREYSPFRVEEGRLYFTTLENDGLNVYRMNIKSKEVDKIFSRIEEYDSFVPLVEDEAVYVDAEGNLFHKKNGKEKKIDTQISGLNSPNVLIAPTRDGVLYTKGTHESSDLYMHLFEEDESRLIKRNITEEAYNNFSFATQWSNERNYFVFNNNEVYNNKGEKISNIEATSMRWAPKDNYIAYIQKPDNREGNKVQIGHWQTYIGEKFILHNVDNGEEKVMLKTSYGLVDPIDSIQWSKNGEMTAVLEGKVNRGKEDVLEKIDYKGVQVYHIATEKLTKMEGLKFNFYQLLFNEYVYGKNLGEQGPLEIRPIGEGEEKTFKEPLMLNDKDLFMIINQDKAYLINGDELIQLDDKGESNSLMRFPWTPYAMYYDEKNQGLIIINEAKEMFLYSL
ncbi:hypothetical protein [Alkaliphilus hydrothermalis]|uniref:Lipoprotein n=1 Tax=Alkaliphilus hydrothermalis TaxID=1482730 RepID=A0ABS2NPW7_9FIRM|nr:hypothetical protein [Alkaliphilus hydrothermalis]MBM7614993.1 hypothetical protein [Alkaliphilus hydrothermalis]